MHAGEANVAEGDAAAGYYLVAVGRPAADVVGVVGECVDELPLLFRAQVFPFRRCLRYGLVYDVLP